MDHYQWCRENASSKFGQHECIDINSACLAAANTFGHEINVSLNSMLLNNAKNGGFIDACNHHCGSWSSDLTIGCIDSRVDAEEFAAAFIS